MKTFIINAARGVVSQKKKLDIKSKLLGREWRMLTDEPDIAAKYIFLKDGKLLISINGVSTYSQWQTATESSIIMDEGVATFLYKVVHIDDNLIVLNLDGTVNFCFLINEASSSLANASFEDIQWYLFRHCNIDILTTTQKQLNQEKYTSISSSNNLKKQEQDDIPYVLFIIFGLIFSIFISILLFVSA